MHWLIDNGSVGGLGAKTSCSNSMTRSQNGVGSYSLVSLSLGCNAGWLDLTQASMTVWNVLMMLSSKRQVIMEIRDCRKGGGDGT